MLQILAKTFMTAAREPLPEKPTNHQGNRIRFDTRREAEIEAHLIARRRD